LLETIEEKRAAIQEQANETERTAGVPVAPPEALKVSIEPEQLRMEPAAVNRKE
jgi:hypothetical protein